MEWIASLRASAKPIIAYEQPCRQFSDYAAIGQLQTGCTGCDW